MRLVSSAGAIVVGIVLVGLPLTGRTGPASRLDPVAQTAVQHYVSEVAELGLDEEYHGVWLQSEEGILAHHQGTVPMPAKNSPGTPAEALPGRSQPVWPNRWSSENGVPAVRPMASQAGGSTTSSTARSRRRSP